MPEKCPRCGKTVYHAERQVAEGKSYHGLCLREEIKEKRDNAPKHMFCIQDHPNINPAKSAAAAAAAAGETLTCSGCGIDKLATDKFCSGCGHNHSDG